MTDSPLRKWRASPGSKVRNRLGDYVSFSEFRFFALSDGVMIETVPAAGTEAMVLQLSREDAIQLFHELSGALGDPNRW